MGKRGVGVKVSAGVAEGIAGVEVIVLIEGAITLSLFAGLILLYAVFTRLFPIVPVWETAEAAVETEEPPTRWRRAFGVRRMEGK